MIPMHRPVFAGLFALGLLVPRATCGRARDAMMRG